MLISKERCPRCSSRGADKNGDNLAVYADGHKWCYACGYIQRGSAIEKLKKQKQVGEAHAYWFIPSSYMDDVATKWLKKYHLTNEEIERWWFWDESGWLVFNGGAYQCARNMVGNSPKYLIRGTLKTNWITLGNTSGSSVVLVEDAVSALKVSRVTSCVPIHNAVISIELLSSLTGKFKKCIIWLDGDKRREVLKEAEKAKPFFDEVEIVWTEKDPKCYTTTEIKGLLQ